MVFTYCGLDELLRAVQALLNLIKQDKTLIVDIYRIQICYQTVNYSILENTHLLYCSIDFRPAWIRKYIVRFSMLSRRFI